MLGFINKMARYLAILGGMVLLALIIITCLSVIGRTLNSIGHSDFIQANLSFLEGFLKAFSPINGDYELVEAGVAIAIFMFLPWCQLKRGHAKVELLTSLLPWKLDRILALLWEVLFTLVMILIAWRIYEGMNSKIRNGETTFLLQMPVWWAYLVCTVTAILASFISAVSAWLHFKDVITSNDMIQSDGDRLID